FPNREKHHGGEGTEPPKKKMKVAVLKCPKKAAPEGTLEKAHRSKGKESAEVVETPDRPLTVRELCKVDGRVGKDKYFVAEIFELL
ncbi:hypothetical protein GW17_00036020, partial [Ensete ventricosum]